MAGRGLSVRSAVNAGLAQNTQPDVGEGSDISAVTFDRKGFAYDQDMPRTFRPSASASTALARRADTGSALARVGETVAPKSAAEVRAVERATIASGVRQLDKPRKTRQRIVQRRIGWQATPDRIVITTAERELADQGGGKYTPSGQWQIENRKTYRCASGKAIKRVGDMPIDPPTQSVPDSTTSSGKLAPSTAQRDVAARFPEGAQTLAFLPRPVRASVISHVALPMVFDGVVLQYSNPDSGDAEKQEVAVIRMNEENAVVVMATRHPQDTTWKVTQATYALGPPEIEQA